MKEKINIIHDKETEFFFQKIGLLENLLNDEIRCVLCDTIINLNNFRGAFKKDNQLFFVCDNINCFSFNLKQEGEEGANG